MKQIAGVSPKIKAIAFTITALAVALYVGNQVGASTIFIASALTIGVIVIGVAIFSDEIKKAINVGFEAAANAALPFVVRRLPTQAVTAAIAEKVGVSSNALNNAVEWPNYGLSQLLAALTQVNERDKPVAAGVIAFVASQLSRSFTAMDEARVRTAELATALLNRARQEDADRQQTEAQIRAMAEALANRSVERQNADMRDGAEKELLDNLFTLDVPAPSTGADSSFRM
ncbi:MAG TPA: hypothetical protein VEA59_01615 [Patescibacteria group bacterium]|nr:hypothetical protein [Patescibacteria group bacterium]